MTTSRRTFLRITLATGAGVGLAACGGTSGPKSSVAATGSATYWYLTGPPGEGIRTNTVKRFNAANPKTQITATTFQNDAYKTKIKTAIGAGEAPTIIWGWGGGGLKSWVDAGQAIIPGDGTVKTFTVAKPGSGKMFYAVEFSN